MKVTFKVKDESKQSVNISIEKISIANSEEEIDVSSTSKSIIVKGSTQTTDTNTTQNTNTNSSNGTNVSNKNSVKNEKLPNTGSTNITPIIVIGMCVVIITGFIVKLRTIKDKAKY